jgi:hypothetical protein
MDPNKVSIGAFNAINPEPCIDRYLGRRYILECRNKTNPANMAWNSFHVSVEYIMGHFICRDFRKWSVFVSEYYHRAQ